MEHEVKPRISLLQPKKKQTAEKIKYEDRLCKRCRSEHGGTGRYCTKCKWELSANAI